MKLTGSGEPTVEECRRLVGMQRELVQSHAARVIALEAALGPPTLRANDPETGAHEGDELRGSRARGTALHGSWVAKGGAAYAVSAVRLHMDAHGTLLGGMTTRSAATLAPGNGAFDGSFTFKVARPDGRVLGRGSGTLHGSRIAAPQ